MNLFLICFSLTIGNWLSIGFLRNNAVFDVIKAKAQGLKRRPRQKTGYNFCIYRQNIGPANVLAREQQPKQKQQKKKKFQKVKLLGFLSKMEVLKQPWLTRDQMHDGKARYVEMTLSNRDNLEKKITYDRKIASKTSVTEKENQDEDASTEDKENNEHEEESFNWSKFVKDMMQCEQSQMILNILSDLNSHTLVTLGKDQLKDEEAQK